MSRRALVTGAASGIGLATAKAFAAQGYRVLLTDVDATALETALAQVPGGRSATLVLDVREEASWLAAREWVEREWGGLDLLVNNAGVAAGGLIDHVPAEDWEWIVSINLFGVVNGCRVFVPALIESKGHLVNVASMAGLLSLPSMSSYNATKAAVVALSETLKHELKPTGVGVSVVCPEFLATNLLSTMRSPDQAALDAAGRFMTRSTVTADEVAAKIVDAVGSGRFLVFTHKSSPWLWRLKRFAPGVWDREVEKRWTRMRRRFETPTPRDQGIQTDSAAEKSS